MNLNKPPVLTLNISQTATDTVIVTMEGEYETAPKLLNGTNIYNGGLIESRIWYIERRYFQ